LRSARSEAQGAFGDPTMILERAIADPRHIEIQVFGDRHGNAIHLGERDCSVQRRHQKLIEEAPSPAVSDELRARMGAVAVAAIRSIGYEGAGTLEFLLDRSGEFYFMEMNTRLQVEHPVTEAITGLDLVELQLRIAAGEPLGLKQEDVKFSGHAIEVRLCSEDAGHDFMPQSGRMALWQMPDGVRVEHALQSGSEIPPFYDSMIAKIISHGTDRAEARGRLICGLEQTAAFGVTTNQGFLISCLRHPGFARGEATTAFIGNHRDELLAPRADDKADAALAALLLYVTNPMRRLAQRPHVWQRRFRCRRGSISAGRARGRIVRERDGGYVRLEAVNSVSRSTNSAAIRIRFRTDGLMESARFLRDGDRLYVLHRGVTIAVRDLTLQHRSAAAARRRRQGARGHERPRRGGAGQAGRAGRARQPVMTLEAMKMEHVHTRGSPARCRRSMS
jgi:geranyl-CoA carboxylase alpha subunit